MKILLVSTHRAMLTGIYRWIYYYQPLTLQQLAAITPSGHEIAISDEGVNRVDYDKYDDFDLIGISITTPHAFRGYEIADEFRKRGKIVILGGFHPSAVPEEAKQHADSVVVGQADMLWEKILRDCENNKLQSYYYQVKPLDGDKIVRPDRSLTDFYGMPVVQSNRGCPTGCNYCSITNMRFGNYPVFRPLNDVIDEIKSLKSKKFFLCDPSLTIDVDYSKKLFKGIKDFDKKITWVNGNVHILAKDDELLKLSRDAGCVEWLVGFESISQNSLDQAGKTTNKVESYHTAINKIHDYGMNIRGEFIFGFDTDTKNIFSDAIDLIKKLDIDITDFFTLTPYPGTPFYKKIKQEGRILTFDWSKYNGIDVVFEPKNMTPEELLNGTIDVALEMHSYRRIFKITMNNFINLRNPHSIFIQNYLNRKAYLNEKNFYNL